MDKEILERDFYLFDDVDNVSVKDIAEGIDRVNMSDRYLEKYFDAEGLIYKPKPINVHIQSYGGEIYCGLGLFDRMVSSITPVTTIPSGMAMSMGFILTLAGHHRKCYKNTTFLYHQLSNVLMGTLQDNKERMSEDKETQKILEEIVLERTSITKKELSNYRKRKYDKIFRAEEALGKGIIHEII